MYLYVYLVYLPLHHINLQAASRSRNDHRDAWIINTYMEPLPFGFQASGHGELGRALVSFIPVIAAPLASHSDRVSRSVFWGVTGDVARLWSGKWRGSARVQGVCFGMSKGR